MQASMASSETAMKKVQAEGEIRMAELQAKAELEMQKIAANGALSKELAYNDAGAQMGKLLAQMQAMMDMQNEKLEVMERIAMANNKTKEEIAEEASETKIETSKISKKESMESESEAEDDD
jgi:hypothetical protein